MGGVVVALELPLHRADALEGRDRGVQRVQFESTGDGKAQERPERHIDHTPVTGHHDGLASMQRGQIVQRRGHAVVERRDGLATGEVVAVSSSVDLQGYVDRALRSGFPEPALNLKAAARMRWLTSYVDQLVTRDSMSIESGRDPVRLRRYLQAFALNSAGIVDDATLFGAATISKDTARAYDFQLQNLLVVEKSTRAR